MGEIILNVDELIYASFMTESWCTTLESIEELPLPHVRFRALGVREFALIWVVVVVVVVQMIIPDTTYRTEAIDALCAGKQNFVYDFDPNGIIWWAETEPVPGGVTRRERKTRRPDAGGVDSEVRRA